MDIFLSEDDDIILFELVTSLGHMFPDVKLLEKIP